MGGDYLSNLKDTALLVGQEHGVTFALEIGQTAYWVFDQKSNGKQLRYGRIKTS